ncbi:MAG TPA: hypothetical protein VJT13_09040, partial [Xanthobacteraceae bacterium]|nr:hypothetical protein [Xanthobacteraceae bacterium]
MTVISSTAPRGTRRSLVRMLLAGVAVTALASSFATPAVAEEARVKDMSLDVQTPYKAAIVKVSSSDGAKWDTILPGQVGFNAVMRVDTAWPGYVDRVGIFLGKCSNTGCAVNTRVYFAWPASRDFNRSDMVQFSVDKLKGAASGVFGESYGETILKTCNDGHADASKPHTEFIGVDVSFTANTATTA